jgi:hypothetical protein
MRRVCCFFLFTCNPEKAIPLWNHCSLHDAWLAWLVDVQVGDVIGAAAPQENKSPPMPVHIVYKLGSSSPSFIFIPSYIHIDTMGLFHHESDEAKAHEQVGVLSLYFNSSIDWCWSWVFIKKAYEQSRWQWPQGSVNARAPCCCCIFRGILSNFYPSSYHTLINSFPLPLPGCQKITGAHERER